MKVETVLGSRCSRSFDQHKMFLPNNVTAYLVKNSAAQSLYRSIMFGKLWSEDSRSSSCYDCWMEAHYYKITLAIILMRVGINL